MTDRLTLSLLPERLAVCRLPVNSNISAWATSNQSFMSITRTTDELSIVCLQDSVPADIQVERDWKMFKIEGPLDFSLTGILSLILRPLAEAKISIFAISTYDTDYILVKEKNIERAQQILSADYNIQERN